MRMWTATGQAEKRISLVVAILSAVGLIAGITVASLVYQNSRLHDQIAHLESERIMIGLPDERGYFVSTNTIPRREVIDYAHGFVVNCYNWSAQSVDTNMDECTNRMDETLAVQKNQWERARKQQATNQQVTSVYIPHARQLKKSKTGYTYTVEGPQKRLQGRNLYYNQNHRLVVNLRQGQPTAFRPLGLTVESWSDTCLDCE